MYFQHLPVDNAYWSSIYVKKFLCNDWKKLTTNVINKKTFSECKQILKLFSFQKGLDLWICINLSDQRCLKYR